MQTRTPRQPKPVIQCRAAFNILSSKELRQQIRYFQMTVSAWASNSAVIPSYIAVDYHVTVNGTVYYNHGCSLNYHGGQLSQSCSFTVPFKGNGDYWFYATFKDNHGSVVAQAINDRSLSQSGSNSAYSFLERKLITTTIVFLCGFSPVGELFRPQKPESRVWDFTGMTVLDQNCLILVIRIDAYRFTKS